MVKSILKSIIGIQGNRKIMMRNTVLLFTILTFLSGCDRADQTKVVLPLSADGVPALVSSFSGEKAVLVNVWATWCVPCIEEFPYLVEIQNKYQSDLQVIFISADFPEQINDVNVFLKQQEVYWKTYIKDDNDEAFINAVQPEWRGALPVTVIYNKNGTIHSWFERSATFEEFETHVLKAIKS